MIHGSMVSYSELVCLLDEIVAKGGHHNEHFLSAIVPSYFAAFSTILCHRYEYNIYSVQHVDERCFFVREGNPKRSLSPNKSRSQRSMARLRRRVQSRTIETSDRRLR